MLASLVIAKLLVASDLQKISLGDKWRHSLAWQYTGDDLDSTDEETFDIEVVKSLENSYTLKVSQKLVATIFANETVPVSGDIKPIEHDWAIFKNGAVAFFPEARFPLEGRLFRVFQSILPAPAGSPARDASWSQNFEDDGFGMPKAAVYAEFSKRVKDGNEFKFSYREGASTSATNATGVFVRSEKNPFPVALRVQFTNTTMPGGTQKVNALVTLSYKKPDKVSK